MSKVPPWSWLCLTTVIIWHIGLSHQEPRIVCYYTNWSVYRPGTAKFNPQNINPYLCTHLIYAFGGFTKENNFKPFDKYQDIEKGSSRFSPLVASAERRKEFIKNSIKFLRQNHFDGLDLDWEYPCFRDGGKPRDKDNYATLVQELREEYERESEKTGRPRLLLTMAVPAGIEYINKGYDVPQLMKYLDWMNILSYDYHSAFEPAVNHHSPLFSLEEESEYNYDSDLNINHTINHYLEAGAEESKLVLGIPTYGRSYTLFNSDANDIGAPADGPGEMGDATRENGYLAYYEICEKLKDDGWTVEQPNPKAMGPYAYKENQWVGYDDESIVKKKAEFVVERKLGGIMFWSIDNDDFRGTCHGKPYPLIEAAKDIKIDNTIPSTKTKIRPRLRPNRKEEEKTTTTTERHRPVRKRVQSRNDEDDRRKVKTVSTTTNSPALTRYQTPEPPTTPDPGSDFKCEDEGFFPHPRDCKKYFWCLSSGPSELGIVAHQFTSDSCDYTQNVRCVKPKSTTTTSTTSTSTTTTPPSTTRRLPTKTTTTTTTPKYEVGISPNWPAHSHTVLLQEYEYEYEYEDDVKDSEEDPKVIKELINLIRKAGGIEELEKQLKIHKNGSSITDPGSTTPSGFSKVLYERVLKSTTGKTERPKTTVSHTSNSRGPQFDGSRGSDSVAKVRLRPQYTAINRQRSTTEKEPEEDIEDTNVQRPKFEQSGVGRKSNLPEYMTIIRQRPSTTSLPLSEKAEREEEDITTERKLVTPQMPEYVTIRRFRPTTEETSYSSTQAEEEKVKVTSKTENINDYINAVEHNVTIYEEKPESRTESSSNSPRRYTITTEPSSSTTKVSEPVPPKTILRPRPFQKLDTTYTNRYNNPPRRTTPTKIEEQSTPLTQADDYDYSDRTNQLIRRRGSTRFEYPEIYNETQNDQKNYQDRKFRPDIALEISDLSSLTSVDFSKPLNVGGGRRRIPPRRGNTDSSAIDTISTTDTLPPVDVAPKLQNRNAVFTRRTTTTTEISTTRRATTEIENKEFVPNTPGPKPRSTTETESFEPANPTRASNFFTKRNRTESENGILRQRGTTVINETTTSLPNVINRFRKQFRRTTTEKLTSASTTTEPSVSVSTTTETRKRPTRKIIRRYRPSSTTQQPNKTERDNSIGDEDTFRGEEEEENIKLSETTIKERSERINSLQNDKFENKQIFSNFGKTSHFNKGEEDTENYSELFRTQKITHKLNLVTQPLQVTAPPQSRMRKIVRKLGLATLTTSSEHYTPVVQESATEEVTDKISTPHYENVQMTTTEKEDEMTTMPVTTENQSSTTPSSTTVESKPPQQKSTPFYYRSKFSRPPFLLQRTKAITEASTSHATKRIGFRSRYERKRPTTAEITTKSTTPELQVTTLPSKAIWEEIETVEEETVVTPVERTTEFSTVSTTVNDGSEYIESSSTTVNDGNEYMESSSTTVNDGNEYMESSSTTVNDGNEYIESSSTTVNDGNEYIESSSTTVNDGNGYIDSSSTTVNDGNEYIESSSTTVNDGNEYIESLSTTVNGGSSSTISESIDDIFSTVLSSTTESSTTTVSYHFETEQPSTTTTRKFRKRRPSKLRTGLSRNIDTSQKNVNSAFHKTDVVKSYKSKLNLSRNAQEFSTTEPTATATLLHVFAETETTPTSTIQRQTDKIEKLIEINRIVEVSLKEGKLKNHTVSENEVTRLPIVDRVGAISRITNIKVVDETFQHEKPVVIEGKSVVNTFTPKPYMDSESSTIALEGLFQFRNDHSNDELLETEHARYVNVKLLRKTETNSTSKRHGQDEYTTSKAEVVEIIPKIHGDLIRIAPIAISLKTLLEQGIDNITLPNN
ncbi:hypothetical protein RI129_010716 [Pyrocoelia pectoralis]|uniref:chitinase n=1 Tax=Pyrocoelia pectoralis TaxID=417401 RepID=A0AAN7Z8Z8_9COLE